MDSILDDLKDADPRFSGRDGSDRLERGIVYKKTLAAYDVRNGESVIRCALSSRLHNPSDGGKTNLKTERKPRRKPNGHASRELEPVDQRDPIVVGDEVHYVVDQGGAGKIVEVLPRRNQVSRRSAVPMSSTRPFEQVIVANVDQVVPVFAAASPTPKWHLLDRYLVSAEAAGLPALICITKLDLVPGRIGSDDDGLQEALAEYERIGYPVVLTSVVTGEGLTELQGALQGKHSVFLGKSGVGKTSLLNSLEPELGLRVQAVNRVSGKGKHTTTHMEMFPLTCGGAIVDTPGIREFGLWDVHQDDLALFFPEMRPFMGRCRFGLDCQHDEEPGCAVRKAVAAGLISPYRYQSYQRLRVDP